MMRAVDICLLMTMILMSSLATGHQLTKNSSTARNFENGVIKDGVYSNECLGLSFQIPEGWETRGAPGKARHSESKLALLFLIRRKNRNTLAGSMTLEATPAPTREINAQDFVFSEVQKRMSTWVGHELIANSFPVAYNGRVFYRAEYKDLRGFPGSTYQASICTKFRGYFVCERIAADSPEELDQAADFLRGLSFGKDQVNPNCLMGSEDMQIPNGYKFILGSVH